MREDDDVVTKDYPGECRRVGIAEATTPCIQGLLAVGPSLRKYQGIAGDAQ